jgi:putative membrane protein
MKRRTRSRYALSATATALGLLVYGCNHSGSSAPNYGGAGTAATDDAGPWDEAAAPATPHVMAPTMTHDTEGMAATPSMDRGAPLGATNRQPASSVAPVTWGGTLDSPTTDTQYGPAAATGTTADISGLSDAQIAAVLEAIHDGEIRQAQLATTHATSQSVKRFATHMMAAHRAMLGRTTAILARAQITPSDNAVSNQLKSDGHAQLSTLQGMRGREFDRTYIDAQVRGHTDALEVIDRILPNLRNQDLKNEVQNARPHVEEHLREAERVQQELGTGGN